MKTTKNGRIKARVLSLLLVFSLLMESNYAMGMELSGVNADASGSEYIASKSEVQSQNGEGDSSTATLHEHQVQPGPESESNGNGDNNISIDESGEKTPEGYEEDNKLNDNIINEEQQSLSDFSQDIMEQPTDDNSGENREEKESLSAETSEDIENIEDMPGDMSLEDTTEEQETEENSDEALQSTDDSYRELTQEELENKGELKKDLEAVKEAQSGQDYANGEVIYITGSEEEAELAAKAYGEATGYDVILKSFQYGVASLQVSGNCREDLDWSSKDPVENLVKLASDMDNELPPVYPNYYRSIQSLNTEESFDDPRLKKDDDKYQWYHNIIKDKYVWRVLDDENSENPIVTKDNLKNVTVAILDTGLDITDELINVISIQSGNGISTTIDDQDGHGTNVAGIIGAKENNNKGGRGIAAGVKLLPINVLTNDGISDTDIISGLNYIYNNGKPRAKVINMSLGGPYYSGAFIDIINNLYKKDVTIIAAAGNSNSELPFYPASYEHVISVAAVNSSMEKATYSNYGSNVDISAPGGEINELVYSVEATIPNNTVTGMCGTSQASPMVAAATALLYAQNPDITPDEVEYILEETATKIKSKNIGGCLNVARALGMEDKPSSPAPVDEKGQIIEGGIIPTGYRLTLEENKDGRTYYTLNGKNPDISKAIEGIPDISNLKSAGTYLYNPEEKPELGGIGKITIKTQAVRYGDTGAVGTYNYTFEEAKVSGIMVKPSNATTTLLEEKSDSEEGSTDIEILKVAVGKKLSLKAEILPVYAKNKKVTWTSNNTAIATVDAKGSVTARSEGDVEITATAADGSGVSGKIKIRVIPLTKSLVISSTIDTILLYNLYDGEKYNTYNLFNMNNQEESEPDESNHKFRISTYPTTRAINFSSSNKAVVEIDPVTGIMTPKKSGTAKITVMAADGSGVKDTINVKVVTPVTSMEIVPVSGVRKNGSYFVASRGQTLKFNVVFNKGITKPDNVKVIWTNSNQETLGKINNGTLKLNPNSKDSKLEVTVNSLSDDIKILENGNKPDTAVVMVNIKEQAPDIKLLGYYISNEYTGTIVNDFLGSFTHLVTTLEDTVPDITQQLYKIKAYGKVGFSYKSSNPKVACIDDNGTLEFLSHGVANITITALDNPKNKAVIEVWSIDENIASGYGYTSGNQHDILYPGKTISYRIAGYDMPTDMKKDMIIAVTPDGMSYTTAGTGFDIIGSKIKANKSISEVKAGTVVNLTSVTPEYIISDNDSEKMWNIFPLEIYPVATASVAVELKRNGDTMELGETIEPGEYIYIKASSLPESACQKYYTYSSSNAKVAKVDAGGRITGVSNGTAKITVTSGDGTKKKAVVTVNVCKKATSIDVTTKTGSFDFAQGKTLQLVATVDAGAGNKKVTYTSNNENILVDKNGKVSLAKGATVPAKATITIEPIAGGNSKEVKVYVKPATTTITLEKTLTMSVTKDNENNEYESVKNTFDYKPESTESDKVSMDFAVTSSNTKVVKVEKGEAGKFTVTALKPGKSVVKVSALDGTGKSASMTVNVTVPVTEMSIVTATGVNELLPGKSLQLKAVTNADATNKNVIWEIVESDASEIPVTINAKGKLTVGKGELGIEDGYVQVKAKALDGSNKTAECKYCIRNIPAATVEVNKTSLTLAIGPKDTNLNNSVSITVDVKNAEGISIDTGFYATSSNTAIANAKIENGQLVISSGTKAGKANISVIAADGSGKKTTIAVTVINPIRQLGINSKLALASKKTKDSKTEKEYDTLVVASGSTIQLEGVVNTDATQKKVLWTQIGNGQKDDISISKDKGVLTVASGITKKNLGYGNNYIRATSTDGSGKYAIRYFSIYPTPGKIKFWYRPAKEADENTSPYTEVSSLTMQKGQIAELKITNEKSDSYQGYYVTYTTGAGKAAYYIPADAPEKSSCSDMATYIKVSAIKKGTITITASTQDGSNKKEVLKIKVTD